MAKKALPVYTRDHRTGSMKELIPDESKGFALVSGEADPFRVLVADDDETDRLLTIWQLGRAWPAEQDMWIECAADSAEALEKIRRQRFALVVLDWNMPHQDGAEVLRVIREDDLRIPVVVVSGQPREAIGGDLETMAAAFVSKSELNPYSLGSAIAMSIQLQEGQCPTDFRPAPLRV